MHNGVLSRCSAIGPGLEHLGRGTVKQMDLLIVVLEPGMRSIKVAQQIKNLGEGLGIQKFGAVLNKVQNIDRDEDVIGKELDKIGVPILGHIPFNQDFVLADLLGSPPTEIKDVESVFENIDKIKLNIISVIDEK